MARTKKIITECENCGSPEVYKIGFCRKCHNDYSRRLKFIREGKPIPPELESAPKSKRKVNNDPAWMSDKNNFGARALERGSTTKYGKIPEWHFSDRMFPGVLEGVDDERKEAMLSGDLKKFMSIDPENKNENHV
jgi:hypothetical protein